MTLSNRAQKLLERVKVGEWYRAYEPNLPKSMQELVEAGLVTIGCRHPVLVSAYIPTSDYTPGIEEKFGTSAGSVDLTLPAGWWLYRLDHEHTRIIYAVDIHKPMGWYCAIQHTSGGRLSEGHGETPQAAVQAAINGRQEP
jgi:hypothetical protein